MVIESDGTVRGEDEDVQWLRWFRASRESLLGEKRADRMDGLKGSVLMDRSNLDAAIGQIVNDAQEIREVEQQNTAGEMKCRFTCSSIEHSIGADGAVQQVHVRMMPVYSSDPASPNRAFWEATPAGNFEVWLGKAAVGRFRVGQEYDLTISETAKAPATGAA